MTIARGFRMVSLLVFSLVYVSTASGAPVVVYDNTTDAVSGEYAPDGFWPFSQFAPEDGIEGTGDQIILDGTQRTIVEFDLILSSTSYTVLNSVTLTFHPVETSGFPGAPIWTTTIPNVKVEGITSVPFTVPNIEVPDEFIWIAVADSMDAGLATYNQPTIGTNSIRNGLDFFWDYDISANEFYRLYFDDTPASSFGAKVLAIPEPTSMTLLLLGIPVLSRKRKS